MSKTNKNQKNPVEFLGGIALCLLAVILIMNIGPVARILSFPFFFLFGIGSYVIYVAIYVYGFYMVLKEKLLKFKKRTTITSFIFLILGVTILSSLIYVKHQGYEALTLSNNIIENKINFNTYYFGTFDFGDKTYITSDTIKLLDLNTSSGGGYLGALFIGIFSDILGNWFSYVISITCILVAILVTTLPFIIKLFKKTPTVEVAAPIEKEVIEEKTSTFSYFKPIYDDKDIEEEIVREPAKKIVHKQPVSTHKNVTSSLYDSNIYGNTGVLTRATYPFGGQNTINCINNSQNNLNNSPYTPKPSLDVFKQENFKQQEKVVEEIVATKVEEVAVEFEEPTIIEEEIPVVSPTPVINNTYQSSSFNKVDETPTVTTPIIERGFKAITVVEEENKGDEKMDYKARLNIPYVRPTSDLLYELPPSEVDIENQRLAEERKEIITTTLNNFGVKAYCDGYIIGPAVTRYNIKRQVGCSVSQINPKINDLCIELGGVGARFEPVVEGETFSGLEVPNFKASPVSFKEAFESLPDVIKNPLAVPFGKNISGKIVSANFNDFPHLLVAGTTGSGKSIYIHSVITTLIMRNSPDDLKLVLVDPKQVEMSVYSDMPHLLCPIVYEAIHAKQIMEKLTDEMDYRYTLFKQVNATDLKSYNNVAESFGKEKLPYIIVVIDEYADLIDICKDLCMPVQRIAAKARASGIHMLIATQRPSTNVITGVIKSNLPTKVALMTSSAVDSTVIIGEGGAETLLGRGDMLVCSPLISRVGATRCQSPYIQSQETADVVNDIKSKFPLNYDPEFLDILTAAEREAKTAKEKGIIGNSLIGDAPIGDKDSLIYEEIKEFAMAQDYFSISKIVRHFGMGTTRAGKMFDRLVEDGIVQGNTSGSNPKGSKVLIQQKFSGETTYYEPEEEEVIDTSNNY